MILKGKIGYMRRLQSIWGSFRLKVSEKVMKFSRRKSDDLPRYVSRTISKSQADSNKILEENWLEVPLKKLPPLTKHQGRWFEQKYMCKCIHLSAHQLMKALILVRDPAPTLWCPWCQMPTQIRQKKLPDMHKSSDSFVIASWVRKPNATITQTAPFWYPISRLFSRKAFP